MREDEPPAWAYLNQTAHVRYTPFRRRFSYRLFQLMVDVDQVGVAAKRLCLFAYNRPGLFSFYDADHGPRDGSRLRPWAETMWRSAGVDLEGGAIRLLCFPRMLGYVFNPLSVFFGYGPGGDLRGVIYEVHNTFGESHAYVVACPIGVHGGPKRFHVSPFFDVEGEYRFRLRNPDARFALTIENRVAGVRTHLATLSGKKVALSDARLLSVLIGMPLMTLKVFAAIHWEALFIWMRGAGYRAKPSPPEPPATALLAESASASPLSHSQRLG